MSQPLYWLQPGAGDAWTGGHLYNRRLIDALQALGQPVLVRCLPGAWPQPDGEAMHHAEEEVAALPDGARVVVDGLAGSVLPLLAAGHGARLQWWLLCHLPLARETGLAPAVADWLARLEQGAMALATGVIATSPACARSLQEAGLDGAAIRVVSPGVAAAAAMVPERPPGRPLRLLCVANITPRKQHALLIDALAALPRFDGCCYCVGDTTAHPGLVEALRDRARAAGLDDRFRFPGARRPEAVSDWYRWADLLLLPSCYETYGMVVTEAVAHGLPVLVSDGGALPDTLPAGAGRVLPAGEVGPWRDALQACQDAPDLLSAWGAVARRAARTLPDWKDAARAFLAALDHPPEGRSAARTSAGAPTGPGPAAVAPGPVRDRFPADWLALREPVDHSARSPALVERLRAWLPREGPLSVLDLGCGRGSNLRYLAPRLPVAQHWDLLDHDPELLAQARQQCSGVRCGDGSVVSLVSRTADLRMLDTLSWKPGSGVGLVTASALIDLVSADWLQALVERLTVAGAALLVTLSYDGRFALPPVAGLSDGEAALIREVREAFNAHQRGRGPFGDGLGPDATAVLADRLVRAGYRVDTAISPWQVGPEHARLQQGLLAGWAGAASEQRPERADAYAGWADRWLARLAEPGPDALRTLWVGHLDLLALPATV